MSIVERALQKAQAHKPGAAAAQTESSTPAVPHQDETASTAPVRALGPAASPAERDPGITASDLKRIVEIDVERLRAAGRLPPAESMHQTEEEFRRLKWPLLGALTGRGGGTPARNNVVLVTSAEPSEGKSFTSLNLALNIVRDREMRVILVDGDVALPGLTPSMGLDGAPGLNDALDDPGISIHDVTYRTSVEGLFFVPAGKWHEHSPELIAGSRMPGIIEELSSRVGKGVVIFDSPPLLATNEAQAATRYVGHVLLVVRADRTEQRAVQDALALIDKDTPVSAVLNGVQATALSKYYGHYYYSGYGSKKNGGYGYGRYGRGGNDERSPRTE
jgi:protein-tyrosine kinase